MYLSYTHPLTHTLSHAFPKQVLKIMGERGVLPTANITRIELAFSPHKSHSIHTDRAAIAAANRILGGDHMMRGLGGDLTVSDTQTRASSKKGSTGGSPLRG